MNIKSQKLVNHIINNFGFVGDDFSPKKVCRLDSNSIIVEGVCPDGQYDEICIEIFDDKFFWVDFTHKTCIGKGVEEAYFTLTQNLRQIAKG